MVMISGKVRKWGNSFGIVIPKEVARKGKFKVGEKLDILILPKNNVLKETFGSLKGKTKKSTQEILDQTDSELYGTE